VFALASAALLDLAAGPARAENEAGPRPCVALVDDLRKALAEPAPVLARGLETDRRLPESHLKGRLRLTLPTMPPAYTAQVTLGCRAGTCGLTEPAATMATRAWTQRREIGFGTVQDLATLGEVAASRAEGNHPEARAVTASELTTRPRALLSGALLASAIRLRQGHYWETWYVDPDVVAQANAMGTPELREQLVSVLAAAHAHRAVGYDQLHAAVCTNDGTMSSDRAHACSTLPTEAEEEWRRSDRRNQWLVMGGATAIYAGAVTTALVERDRQTGRVIATATGVADGVFVGVVVGTIAAHPFLNCTRSVCKAAGYAAIVAGGIAGGVLGGHWAHGLAPSARAPVTAVGLAPLPLITFVMTFG